MHELAKQLWKLAESAKDRRLLIGAHQMLGETACWMGSFPRQSHYLQATGLYDRTADKDLALYYGLDPFVLSSVGLGHVETFIGRCDRTLNLTGHVRARATEL